VKNLGNNTKTGKFQASHCRYTLIELENGKKIRAKNKENMPQHSIGAKTHKHIQTARKNGTLMQVKTRLIINLKVY
jgi:hypothetical protein